MMMTPSTIQRLITPTTTRRLPLIQKVIVGLAISPVANAGRDIVVQFNVKIILDAGMSSDPDEGDTIVSYLWEQESGPTAEINDQASSNTSSDSSKRR